MIEKRKTQVLQYNKWIKVDLKDIRKGDVFRQFESDGSIVVSLTGFSERIASTDAYNSYGLWKVTVENHYET